MSRKHLGSGLYVCGICGKVISAHTRGYRCPGHVTRNRKNIDRYVLDIVRMRLSLPDIADLMPSADDVERRRIREGIARHKARILRAEADYDEELIEARDLKCVRTREKAAIDKLDVERARLMTSPALAEAATSADPVSAFDALDVGRKQAVIRALMTVRLMPHPKGVKAFDGSDVIIEWKK